MSAIKFTTPVTIPQNNVSINHEQPVLLLGSCFAQNIGELLKANKFNVTVNPNGIIYNPISLAKTLKKVIHNEDYTESELHQHQNKWISFAHHGSFSSTDKATILNTINQSSCQANSTLKLANTLIVTFGSAWVYEYEGVGVVANCHKIPAKHFTKRLLEVDEVVTTFLEVLYLLKTCNPALNIIFTVSPVRHAKDGLHENNLSKAVLHLSIKQLIEQHQNCSYFPAYEIVIDELRDYRYFKDDLVHPSEMAIKFVWEKFGDAYFDEETLLLNEAIRKVIQSVNHRPFDFHTEAHQLFVKALLDTIKNIQVDFPYLDFEKEKKMITTDPYSD